LIRLVVGSNCARRLKGRLKKAEGGHSWDTPPYRRKAEGGHSWDTPPYRRESVSFAAGDGFFGRRVHFLEGFTDAAADQAVSSSEKTTEDPKFRFWPNNRGDNLSKRVKNALARVKTELPSFARAGEGSWKF